MANIKGNKGKNFKGGQNKIRCNERIKAQEVRLISPEGNMIGVGPIEEALAEARKYGLDLIEISPNANPVVCRILDFGKYQYETSKKQKSSKSPVHGLFTHAQQAVTLHVMRSGDYMRPKTI